MTNSKQMTFLSNKQYKPFYETFLLKQQQNSFQSNKQKQNKQQFNKTSLILNQKMSKTPNSSRMVLPNISTTSSPQISYAQRYEHMTKLANYSQMNQGQIWKQYEKLRACLKQINEEVLYHMQRKAYTNLNKDAKQNKPASKDSQGVLMLLQDQKATNELRYSNFYNELSKLEERIGFLSSKHNYLQNMTLEIQDLQAKIKKTQTQIKDYKRKAKIVGKNIVNCTSTLDKLIMEETKLGRALIRHRRLKEYLQSLDNKEDMYKQRIAETQKAIQMRINQFALQENFIQEQIHFERYEQLKKLKENLTKYESVYKRNYLMKLKELQGIINSINKHDKIIQDNEGNIASLRSEVETVSQLMGKTAIKKRSASSMMQMSMNTARVRAKETNSRGTVNESMDAKESRQQGTRVKRASSINDKNQD